MTDKNILISICIPAYNCGMYIQDTLRCLCCQTYSNIEIIVVNDGSSDDTLIKIEDVKDDRIILININNRGAAGARNIAYNNSRGEYIVFFDADDLVKENFLTTQIEILRDNINAIVLSPWARFYEDYNLPQFIDKDIIPRDMSFRDWIINYWSINKHTTPPGRVLMPRGLIEKAGLWDETLSLNDDLDFYTRIFSVASIIKHNINSTFYYRSGIDGLSSIKGEIAAKSDLKATIQSIEVALKIYPLDANVSISCSGLLQGFIYNYYPIYPELRSQALTLINILGKSELKYECGGKTAALEKLIGWKMTKRLKHLNDKIFNFKNFRIG